MPRYKNKEIVVTAVQWQGWEPLTNTEKCSCNPDQGTACNLCGLPIVRTPTGPKGVHAHDWLIVGPMGDMDVLSDKEFQATYDLVIDPPEPPLDRGVTVTCLACKREQQFALPLHDNERITAFIQMLIPGPSMCCQSPVDVQRTPPKTGPLGLLRFPFEKGDLLALADVTGQVPVLDSSPHPASIAEINPA